MFKKISSLTVAAFLTAAFSGLFAAEAAYTPGISHYFPDQFQVRIRKQSLHRGAGSLPQIEIERQLDFPHDDHMYKVFGIISGSIPTAKTGIQFFKRTGKPELTTSKPSSVSRCAYTCKGEDIDLEISIEGWFKREGAEKARKELNRALQNLALHCSFNLLFTPSTLSKKQVARLLAHSTEIEGSVADGSNLVMLLASYDKKREALTSVQNELTALMPFCEDTCFNDFLRYETPQLIKYINKIEEIVSCRRQEVEKFSRKISALKDSVSQLEEDLSSIFGEFSIFLASKIKGRTPAIKLDNLGKMVTSYFAKQIAKIQKEFDRKADQLAVEYINSATKKEEATCLEQQAKLKESRDNKKTELERKRDLIIQSLNKVLSEESLVDINKDILAFIAKLTAEVEKCAAFVEDFKEREEIAGREIKKFLKVHQLRRPSTTRLDRTSSFAKEAFQPNLKGARAHAVEDLARSATPVLDLRNATLSQLELKHAFLNEEAKAEFEDTLSPSNIGTFRDHINRQKFAPGGKGSGLKKLDGKNCITADRRTVYEHKICGEASIRTYYVTAPDGTIVILGAQYKSDGADQERFINGKSFTSIDVSKLRFE